LLINENNYLSDTAFLPAESTNTIDHSGNQRRSSGILLFRL